MTFTPGDGRHHDFRGVSMLDVFPLTIALIPFAAEFVLALALVHLVDHGSAGWAVAAVGLMAAMGVGMATFAHYEVTTCGGVAPCVAYPTGEATRTATVAGLAWASQAGLMAAFAGDGFSEVAGSWFGSCVAVVFALTGGAVLSRVHL